MIKAVFNEHGAIRLAAMIHEPWRASYENFFNDMGEAGHDSTLERRDKGKPYGPKNCYWKSKGDGRVSRPAPLQSRIVVKASPGRDVAEGRERHVRLVGGDRPRRAHADFW